MSILKVLFLSSMFSLFFGLMSFVGARKHLLSTLLSLEFIMLSIFWLLSSMIVQVGGECYFLLYFLSLAACEGALGLGLLVSVVRSHGSDNFSSFSSLSC
uniref:NADH dehydrogenase subunit 4L n=1 Tax=Amphionides reynaudii TaxID=1727191 RepID=UPI0021D53778|nr:NADH dehydrogenase subunit 4L [Amphionides reynaudii]UXG18832.1 NADH dehydrogenase subunit 4L [Amphionides reynaudii]